MVVKYGDEGNNYLPGTDDNDELYGLGGDDSFDGFEGDDTIDGGDGADFASYVHADAHIEANLAAGKVTSADGNDTVLNMEGIGGSIFGDVLDGTNGDNSFYGNAGDDTLRTLGGTDTLNGGPGNDTLDGGEGRDTADYLSDPTGVFVDLYYGIGQDGWEASSDDYDTIRNVEGVTGAAYGNDTLLGDDGVNYLDGGWQGDDYLVGRDGIDHLYGELGDDTLYGDGTSVDGGGDGDRDYFHFGYNHGDDVIGDFEDGTDQIFYNSSVDWVRVYNFGYDAVLHVEDDADHGTVTIEGMAGKIDGDDIHVVGAGDVLMA